MTEFIHKIRRRLKSGATNLLVKLTSQHLNWPLTIYFNFLVLPFQQAVRLPVYVYGKPNLLKLDGRIEIDCPPDKVSRGMIKLNKNLESSGAPGGNMALALGPNCKIAFEGKSTIGFNTKILLWGGGFLKLGHKTVLGLGTNIICCSSITMENNVRLGPEVTIYDNDAHFSYSRQNGEVRRYNASVRIGHHSWLGTRATIMKGIILPPYTTVASCALVKKNVADNERTLIGGIPARVLSRDFSRVFNLNEEMKIYDFFCKNPSANSVHIDQIWEKYD